MQLIIRIGDRGHPDKQVKLPATLSADGRSMLFTGKDGGWFRPHSVIAVRQAGGWKSRIGYDLTVEKEHDGDRWRRVYRGSIPC